MAVKRLSCTGHTSDTDFYVDLNVSLPRWNPMTDGLGLERRLGYTPTYYKTNDLVKYGGQIYICSIPIHLRSIACRFRKMI